MHCKLSEIKDWFSNGLDEVAVAHSWSAAAQMTGNYSVSNQDCEDITSAQRGYCKCRLALSFTINEGAASEKRVLEGEGLDKFIQQLSLIQGENDATSADMLSFVDQYQDLVRTFENVITMNTLGYEKISILDFYCRAGVSHIHEAKKILNESEAHMITFRSWLLVTRETYPASLLFWTEELREICEMLIRTTSTGELYADVELQISRLQQLRTLVLTAEQYSALLQNFVNAFLERMKNSPKSWLSEVSRFLENVHHELGNESASARSGCKSIIALHSLTCTDSETNHLTLSILQRIYKVRCGFRIHFCLVLLVLTASQILFQDRLPYTFEILDGSTYCSLEQITVFLGRVKAFPLNTFAILNAEKLESSIIEAVLVFFSDRRIEAYGFTLHCIQRGDTLIHPSPWIKGESWDRDSVNQHGLTWKPKVLKNLTLSVIASPKCGTGKTKHIRQTLKRFQSRGHEVASIVVHEMSSISSLVTDLKRKLQGTRKRCALHISVAWTPSLSKNSEVWLQQLNSFMFSLLVLHSVYDPLLSTSFSFTAEEWHVFIEMPESIASQSSLDWLSENVPIVSACATCREPSRRYKIDKTARRVGVYLRAYETGTINRKFDGGAKKRIILVLDCSGSM